MHLYTLVTLVTLLSTWGVAASEVNGKCTGKNGAPGVCIATAKCTSGGGTYISNACPGTPDDIKCCTKPSCGSGGNCRWTSQCTTGNIANNLCPGPNDFKCCLPKDTSDNTSYPTPSFPSVGACKKRSVDGAKKIVAANPGKVRQIYCTRDCSCPGDSDHCCGLAVDLMCSKAGGVKTTTGRPIAEWVMNHRKDINLKYVIWGQKIWNPSRDAVKPWSQWRDMEDRGSITANHWDHVHVSFDD
ncbi:hypothetical protein FRC14_004484 [Serendipita sp. 396]|nr:hypothetical protein FRC14_004484 [Serendipita sp. 396]KAG8781891.1 hypothetical protein FRC15_007932 [Serendipita sp. 397]KAG8783838.1 hypothetical protein FRC15_004454 [Serendipita sp. 397]KAG8798200.1 hypothetical protein FRC16_007739 [Serendipita sp. 398]KAG8798877.1 hypothetical protein FRC16_006369 [Serendipita sp. 398]